MRRALPAVVAVAALATGCGSGHEDAVLDVGDTYGQAVSSGRWASACALLAPTTRSELQQSAGKPCDQALREEEPPAVSGDPAVHVYGSQAQLKYDGETLFLSQYDGRWRIVAAACEPRSRRPHDCSVKVG